MNCQEVCFQLFADKTAYYHQWYHDRPMLITSERRDELRRMQALLYKCIVYMAEHYREWVPQYMPLDDKVMEVLDRQSRYPFRAGAYRPDYLISDDGQLLLVEITCRFFGHGIWANYPSVVKAELFMAEHPDASWENRYDELLTCMRDAIPANSPVYVLKSGDRGSESTFYTKFYEYYRHEVTIYEAAEVEANIDLWSHDAVVLSALNQHDLLSFKMETLQAMIDVRMLNDFRTIFLAHDKRFLSIIFVDEFTQQCLTEDETVFLRQHTIPTYIQPHPLTPSPKGEGEAFGSEEIWEDALTHKDEYILKPYDLGKSVGLYAGVMTDEETWRNTLGNPDYILQPFIHQRTYPCEWQGRHYDEYVCGMMLCMDDCYFDSGMMRTSSAPVTNKVDDRKMCVIHSDDNELKTKCFVL
ncbi:hypothetical protein [uncultured Prevotella sp.]|uniref:hypothetical protein n=1 Tax=uncultured Prevotella sp. TaxID=159272 RepID=UPI0025D279E3|nr:hypothetical protein [uncultured Prevotella sp.]